MAAVLTPADFLHPEDAAAQQNLEGIPLFEQAVRAFMELGYERMLHGSNMAQKIRLGPSQLPRLYRFLPPICGALGIEEPEFYLERGEPNAYTFGDTRIFVTVTSGLVSELNEDEFRAVLAHECGHIAARHTLYRMMAELLFKMGADFLGPLRAAVGPLRLAMSAWQRRSELTADRAAMALIGEADVVVRTMIRLAGGPRELTHAVDVGEYLRQAEQYDAHTESSWNSLLQQASTLEASHPLLSVRAREAVRWEQTEHFKKVREAMQVWREPLQCPACAALIGASWTFCRRCGGKLPTIAASVPAAAE